MARVNNEDDLSTLQNNDTLQWLCTCPTMGRLSRCSAVLIEASRVLVELRPRNQFSSCSTTHVITAWKFFMGIYFVPINQDEFIVFTEIKHSYCAERWCILTNIFLGNQKKRRATKDKHNALKNIMYPEVVWIGRHLQFKNRYT